MNGRFWIVLLYLVFSCSIASAHQTGKSALLVNITPGSGEVETLLTLPLRDIVSDLNLDKNADEKLDRKEVMATRSAMTAYFDKHIFVRNTRGECTVKETRVGPVGRLHTDVWFMKVFKCSPLDVLTFELTAMHDKGERYVHIGRIELKKDVHSTMFDNEQQTYELRINEPPTAAELISRFLQSGIKHVGFGWDHVVFIIALAFASRRLRDLLLFATAFTVGHSLSLSAATFDWFSLPSNLTEPLIAASIVLMGVEVYRQKERPLALGIVLLICVGVIHGLGFSSVLTNADLFGDQQIHALIGFNLGVEVAQIGILLLAFPVGLLIEKKIESSDKVWKGIGVAIGIAGLVALSLRVFG